MTKEEAKSCIGTIEMLQRLAYNIHGVMDVIDADNCKKIIKALEQEPKMYEPQMTRSEKRVYLLGDDSEAIQEVISTMHKYKKIQEILDDCDLEAWEVLEKIKEVVANDD